MDILLVSGRGAGGTPHASAALSGRLAEQLALRGHAVRQLHGTENGRPPKGIEDRLCDAELEIALTQALRPSPPPLVHVLAFGGTSSTQTAWIAARLGAPTVVSLDVKVATCERGTLLHASGTPCTTVDDPVRCASCCGLPPRAVVALENRFDLVFGGLQPASLVLVGSEDERALLLGLGLPQRQVRVLAGLGSADAVEALVGLYSSLTGYAADGAMPP